MLGPRLLYAPNIHQGGGKTLLLPLLEALKSADDITLVLDERMQLPEGFSFAGKVYRVKATLVSRLLIEWRLRHLITPDTSLLCMGSLPPLLARNGHQQVFVQNRYLIDDVPLSSFRLSVRIRLMIERWWLRSRSFHVNRFIVQTPTMQLLLNNALDVNADLLPFVASKTDSKLHCSNHEKKYDFLYVASGEPHKNHKRLIEAWIKLAKQKLFPTLCLTLDVTLFPDLCEWITIESKKYGLNVSMIGECSHDEIQYLYKKSAAMIYPSLFESFGLPLIEAAAFGLPILASNSSYVVDVIMPTDQFNPFSSQSIADAVSQFSFKPASLNIDLLTADEFLQRTIFAGSLD